MNRVQKIAWSFIIMISVSFILSGILVTILYVRVGVPKALYGFSLLGIAGLAGFSPLIFKKDKGKVTFDERDKLIKNMAALIGFAASYLFVGLACMIPFSILGPKGSISVRWLPNIFGGAAFVMFFAWSVAILVQYGRGGKGEKS